MPGAPTFSNKLFSILTAKICTSVDICCPYRLDTDCWELLNIFEFVLISVSSTNKSFKHNTFRVITFFIINAHLLLSLIHLHSFFQIYCLHSNQCCGYNLCFLTWVQSKCNDKNVDSSESNTEHTKMCTNTRIYDFFLWNTTELELNGVMWHSNGDEERKSRTNIQMTTKVKDVEYSIDMVHAW